MLNLENLYAAQQKLDDYVSENLDLDIDLPENVEKRVFALKVEVAELANEVGFFKYWKTSHVMNREKTLEELADCIHFFLSVGLSRGYDKLVTELDPHTWKSNEIKNLFEYLMGSLFENERSWKFQFELLLAIGLKLGFSIAEMEVAYYLKNEKNIQRQQSNY